jgi:ribonuclease T2
VKPGRARRLAALALFAVPGAAGAQAYQCTMPTTVGRPRPELPGADQPARVLPIGGYTLALTWAPEFCHGKARNASMRFECGGRRGGGNRFGFTLHGLWPDGIGKDWPQYCTAAALLPSRLIARHLCSTPSAQLLQHEWAKHGTCMQTTPTDYFARSTGMYAKLHYPDMDALSRKAVTAADFRRAMASVNPGLPASAIRVTANSRNWLDELWLCLNRQFGYVRCKANTGGLSDTATIRIWREGR